MDGRDFRTETYTVDPRLKRVAGQTIVEIIENLRAELISYDVSLYTENDRIYFDNGRGGGPVMIFDLGSLGSSGDTVYGMADVYVEEPIPNYGLFEIDGYPLKEYDKVFYAYNDLVMGIWEARVGAWVKLNLVSPSSIVNIKEGQVYGGSSIKMNKNGTTQIVRLPYIQKWHNLRGE